MSKMFKKTSKLKYFWHLVVMMLILAYIYIEFNPLFTNIPSLRRYLQHDFMRSFPGINYLMESFNIRSLRFYHWNQFAAAGSPNVNEMGTYYFPNYILKLFYKLNHNFLSIDTYQVFTFAHYILAGLGFYLFVRPKVKIAWPVVFGTLYFISSSLMMYAIWSGYVFAISLLPWILICLEKYFSCKKFAWLSIATFITFQMFAINPQFFFYSLIFVTLYFLIYRYDFRTVKILIGFYLLTVGYSAITLLPLQELSGLASRTKYFNYDYFNLGANQMSGIWQFVLTINKSEENLYIYLGGLAITLIAIYFQKTKSKIDWSLLGLAVFLFLFFSSGTFFQSIIRLLPGLDSARAYFRANELIIFILIILLVKAIANYSFNLKKDLIITASLVLFIIFGYLIKADFQSGNFELLASSLFSLILFLLLLSVRNYKLINDRLLMIIVCVLIFIDLSRVVRVSQNLQEANYKTNLSGELAKSEWFLVSKTVYETDNQSRIPADNFLDQDYNKFLISRSLSAGAFSAEGGEFSSAVLKKYDDYQKVALENPKLLALENVNTKEGYLPRAFVQNCFKVETSDESLLKKLQDTKFTGQDFVYLSEQPKIEGLSQDCKSQLVPVVAIQDKDQISFGTVQTSQPTILFISDNYYPGWNAYVDGQKTEILRANYTFKAVALPAGNHSVQFKYEPLSFKIGGFITWLSIILSLVIIIFEEQIKHLYFALINRRRGKDGN